MGNGRISETWRRIMSDKAEYWVDECAKLQVQVEQLKAKLDAVRDMSSIVLKLLQENPWPTSDTRWQTVEEMAKTNLKAQEQK
jgi:hypothetical protein